MEIAERGRRRRQRRVHRSGSDAGSSVDCPLGAERQLPIPADKEPGVFLRLVPFHGNDRENSRQELHSPAESRYAT